MMQQDELLTVQEARQFFDMKVSEGTIYKLYRLGKLPGCRVGRILLYRSGLEKLKKLSKNSENS